LKLYFRVYNCLNWKKGSTDLKGRLFDSKNKFNKKVRENYLELVNILPGALEDNSIV